MTNETTGKLAKSRVPCIQILDMFFGMYFSGFLLTPSLNINLVQSSTIKTISSYFFQFHILPSYPDKLSYTFYQIYEIGPIRLGDLSPRKGPIGFFFPAVAVKWLTLKF